MDETFVAVTCGACTITFGMPEQLYANRKADGATWYCPIGHPRQFRRPEIERLKAELEAERQRRQAAEREAEYERTNAKRRVSALKGQVTKRLRRLGVPALPAKAGGGQ